jgi:Inositol hexakisphosphate
VSDLSSLSKSGSATRSLLPGKKNDVAISGGQILGDEYSDHVMKVPSRHPLLIVYHNLTFYTLEQNRSGIILRERSVQISVSPKLRAHNNYTSTLLKSDQWLRESHYVDQGVRGAINFRRVPDTKIYALGQPTLEAIDEVVSRIKKDHPTSSKIVWITLREEPIVYINGAPYCLRRENFSLRNMKGKVFPTLLNRC